jgi:phenylalanyl-tRNA synthetase beta chain
LKTTLERVGLRSINNVVDVTNYVLWETGQPLHGFNFNALTSAADGRRTITVRRSHEAERLVTLDGQDRLLPSDSLLIADDIHGLALAGIMGGKDSEITSDTTDILLESAYFHPTGIRRTSKLTGLRSDASYRYERGADIDQVDYASRRAAALIAELAGGSVVPGMVEFYPTPSPRKSITVRYRKVNELLGTRLESHEIGGYLARLGLNPPSGAAAPASDALTVEVPSFRVDLKREADLIEEVARLFGVERIPTTTPRGAIGTHPFDSIFDELTEARGILNGLGLDEAQGQTLISARTPRPTPVSDRLSLALENPLSSDMDQLRPTLLPGLLDSVRHNLHQRNTTIRLFEIGRTFSATNGTVRERWQLGIVLTGLRNARFWEGTEREARLDGADIKGLIEDFAEAFGLSGLTWSGPVSSDAYFLESAEFSLGGRVPLGRLGQLAPTVARSYDARDPVWVAELDFDQVLRRRSTLVSFKPLPQFPSVRRDLAMVVPEATSHEAILATIRQARTPHLETVELFDLFRGSPVPDGHKSLAYAFTYRALDKTLKEEEVTASQARLSELLRQSLGATLRE